MSRTVPAYEVEVEHFPEDEVWTGINEEIGLFLEAPTFPDLIREAWLIAPDLLEIGKITPPGDGELRLKFSILTAASEHAAE